jgi:hypothetical protein
LGTSPGIPQSSRAYAAGLVLCFSAGGGVLANPPPDTHTGVSESSDSQPSVHTGSFFSSLKQAFKQDFDHEVVRGHFDVGSPPDAHRYYCLVDANTGKSEANGVGGQPVLRADGMTGIKAGAVSLYSCVNAEQQGILVTTGYVLSASAGGMIAPVPPAQRAAGVPEPNKMSPDKMSPDKVSPDKIDVAGVRLGMSPDQVRAVLKSKKLLNYYESAETLVNFGGHFVNVIAAWTSPPSSSVADAPREEGEAYEVMFTPVPGKERVMAIVHSAAYSPANAVREAAVENGLVTKYSGFSRANDLPRSPTWRIQSGGNVLVGDPCNRRGIFGGLGELKLGTATRQNLALKTTPEEFRFQIDSCGVAIVTEDHSTANGDAPREDRVIARFTVTAYSPSIAFEDATTAARLTQTAGDTAGKAHAPHTQDQLAPNL